MSDAKELVERLDALAKYLDHIDASDKAQAVVDDARDWIERWAPVVEAMRGCLQAHAALCNEPHKTHRQIEHHAAADRLYMAAKAALGEDKP